MAIIITDIIDYGRPDAAALTNDWPSAIRIAAQPVSGIVAYTYGQLVVDEQSSGLSTDRAKIRDAMEKHQGLPDTAWL